MRQLFVLAAACLIVAGCAPPEGDLGERGIEPIEADPGPNGAVSAPFDVGAVAQKVHFAYRAEEGAFSGGHRSYGVRVESGQITLTPSEPREAPAGDKRARRPAPRLGAPLTLDTVSIAAGRSALSISPSPAAVNAEGALEIPRGAATEHLRNTAEGVEQSWVFAESPAAGGDLVIRVRATGETYLGETEGGLHFGDAATGLGFRYGLGAWVDAQGQRTEVRPRLEGDDIVLTVPRAVVEASAYPAELDPLVGPETGLDSPILSSVPGYQLFTKVAFDGTNFLVVWSDERNGGNVFGSTGEIFGTRVSQSGVVLDPSGINLRAAATEPFVGLAFDGTNYLLAWGDSAGIEGTRVSKAGVALDPSPILISPATDTIFPDSPEVACDGTSCLVVWEEFVILDVVEFISTENIRGARVNKAGRGLDPAGIDIEIAPPQEFATFPKVAWNGQSYLVVWNEVIDPDTGTSNVQGARVSKGGSVLTQSPILIAAAPAAAASVACSTSTCLVIWNAGGDAFGRLVSSNGLPLSPSSIPIATGPDEQDALAVAFDGTNYLIVWEVDFDADGNTNSPRVGISGARVSKTGTLLDPTGITIAQVRGGVKFPTVAFGANNFFVSWNDIRLSPRDDIFGARVSRSGLVLDPNGRLLSTMITNEQLDTAVAFDGTNYLVVWQDDRNGAFDIFGSRVTAAGVALDLSAIPISRAADDQRSPSVTFGGGNYLVAWDDLRSGTTLDIFGARVSPAGHVLDADGIPISTAASDQIVPRATFGGGKYFVVWEDFRNLATSGADIFGARVGTGGAVLDPAGLPISTEAGDQEAPAVDSDSSNYLVVWEDSRRGVGFAPDVFGGRVRISNGARLDGGGFVISASSAEEVAPAVAFDGTNHLVVWQDNRNGSFGIFGARVTCGGALLDPLGVTIEDDPASDQTAPALAFGGGRYLIVWVDDRALTSSDILGRAASPSLSLGATFPVGTSSDDERAPALAAGPAKSFLVTYERPAPEFGLSRARARVVQF